MGKLLLKELHVEILPKGNSAAKWNPQTGGADAEAEALRQEILNTKDNLVITGTTYYISPNGDDANDGTSPKTAWKTVDAVKVHDGLIKAGDGVLFERGGVYRTQAALSLAIDPTVPYPPRVPTTPVIVAKSGVSYGAYGEGPKPAIYGSFKNYAWEECWEPTEWEHIWRVETPHSDAGLIVFNHGEEAGVKKFIGIEELKQNFDFFHDVPAGLLYLYLDTGCPHMLYEDIEIGTREDFMFVPPESENIVVDNLAIKYFGHYGVTIKRRSKNISFTNCEIGWIGGCIWVWAKNPCAGARLGNGIEFWESAENALMENNWVYQVYDAGLSPQGIDGPGCYRNMVMRKNLIEYCSYNIEWFDRNPESLWDGYYIEDNILRFAGYGWGRQRKDGYATSNICAWTFVYDHPLRVYIRNNIFDCSDWNTVYWHWEDARPYPDLEVSGNTFYDKESSTGKAIHFAGNVPMMATNQAELETAIKTFDRAPKKIEWLS